MRFDREREVSRPSHDHGQRLRAADTGAAPPPGSGRRGEQARQEDAQPRQEQAQPIPEPGPSLASRAASEARNVLALGYGFAKQGYDAVKRAVEDPPPPPTKEEIAEADDRERLRELYVHNQTVETERAEEILAGAKPDAEENPRGGVHAVRRGAFDTF